MTSTHQERESHIDDQFPDDKWRITAIYDHSEDSAKLASQIDSIGFDHDVEYGPQDETNLPMIVARYNRTVRRYTGSTAIHAFLESRR